MSGCPRSASGPGRCSTWAGDARELGQARETLRVFTEGGGRVIDSSPMYGRSEAVTGELAAELGVPAKLFVATKVWTSGKQAGIRADGGLDAQAARRAARPDAGAQPGGRADASRDPAEWKAAGRVRYVGITHYHAGGHAELEAPPARGGDVDFVQVNYSLAEPRGGARACSGRRRRARGGDREPAVRGGGDVRAGEGEGGPGVGAGGGVRELGAVLPQVDPGASRRSPA